MDIDDMLSKLERSIKQELGLNFTQIQRKETGIGFDFYLNTSQGNKTLTITKYLVTDTDFCDLKNYVINTLMQFDNSDKLELTKQSFDDFYN